MRINLRCPFAEKDQARQLGARWDQVRKVWYILDIEDITPFMRWIERPNPKQAKRDMRLMRSKAKREAPKVTESVYVPSCGCDHVPPWEDCEHTADMGLGEEESAHIRSILGERQLPIV